MTERGYSFTTKSEFEILTEIKHKLCFIAEDYNKEYQNTEIEQSYVLPDGQCITIGTERFRASELLFDPSLNGLSFNGIDKTIYETIMKCDKDIRSLFYSNIILSGGSSMFNGIEKRLAKEMNQLAPSTEKITIISSPERKYFSWIGASIFASLSSMENMWVTKNDYDENGAQIIHRKCF